MMSEYLEFRGRCKELANQDAAEKFAATKPYPENGRGDYYVVQEHEVREAIKS